MKNSFFKKILASSTLSLIILFYISILVIPAITSAQNTASSTTGCVSTKDEYCLLEPIVVNGASQDRVNIASYLGEMFKIGIGLAGIFAVFMIIWGGFEYVSTDAIAGKSAGKEKIEGALWGLGLALGSYLILNTINPELLKFSAGPEPIKVEELAKRIKYTDVYLANNRKLDAVRTELDECNRKAENLRNLGDEKAADAARLKCKVDAARNSVLAKSEAVGIKDFFGKSTSREEDAKARKAIFDGGKGSIAQYYDKEIVKLEKILSESNDPEATDGEFEITKQINLLKAQKSLDLTKSDQDYDTQRALDEISLFGTKGASKIKEAVDTIKRGMNERSVEAYNRYKKDYPSEAETVRVDRIEKIKKIDTAYKEALERLNNSINTASGPTIGG